MAAALGADAVGFLFAPSPRQVTVGTARDIARRLPPEIMTIGVFRDQTPKFVIDTVLEAHLRGAQLHGHETPAMAAEIRPKVQILIAAFPAGDAGVERFDEFGADALLLDGTSPGSGAVFDWSLVDSMPDNRRLIVAGGLDPTNVSDAIMATDPWGVDVSTGVESSPGHKDPRLVQAFIHAAKETVPKRPSGVVTSPSEPGPFDWSESGDV